MKNTIKYFKTGALVLITGLFSCFSEDVWNNIPRDQGLLYVYVQSPTYVAPDAPPAQNCDNWNEYPSAACIRESECYGLRGTELDTCIGTWRVAIQNGTYRHPLQASSTGSESDDEHDEHDDDDDDDDDDAQGLQTKIKVEIESVEVLAKGTSNWITISSNDDDDERIDLADGNLNERVGAKELLVQDYSAIRINFGDHNEFFLPNCGTTSPGNSGDHRKDGEHRKEDAGEKRKNDPEKHQDSQEQCNGYIKKPLLFQEGDPHSMVVRKDFSVDALELLEIFISFDMEKSLALSNGQVYFTPSGYLKGLTGGGYHQPEEAINQEVTGAPGVIFQAPPFAATEPIKITAAPVTQDFLVSAPLPSSNEVMVAGYEFQPSQVFQKPVTVTIPYDQAFLDAKGIRPEQLRARYYNENSGEWILIPTAKVNPATGTIDIHTKHFTIINVTTAGFEVHANKGISALITYNFLSYIADKVVPLSNPSLGIQYSESTSYDQLTGIRSKTVITPGENTIRNFELQFVPLDPANNILGVRVRTRKSFIIAEANINVWADGMSTCDIHYDACMAKAGNWLDELGCRATRLLCYGGQLVLQPAAQGHLRKRVLMKGMDVTLAYEVQVERKSNTINFIHRSDLMQKKTVNGLYGPNWLNVDLQTIEISGLGAFITDGLVAYYEHFIVNVLNDKLNSTLLNTANVLAHSLNTEFANSDPLITDFQVTPKGLAVHQQLTQLIDSLDYSGNCAFAPNLPVPTDPYTDPETGGPWIDPVTGNAAVPPPLVLADPSSSLGLGVSMNAMEQAFTESANRGTFCVNATVPTQGTVQITPTSAPALKYKASHVFEMTMNVKIVVTPLMGSAVTYNVPLNFMFRLQMNIPQRMFRMGLVDIKTDPNTPQQVKNAVATYKTQLKNIGINSYMPVPATYTGLQKSMVSLNHFDEKDGHLHFEFNVGGVRDNSGREWIWTNDWKSFFQESYKNGVLTQGLVQTVCDLYVKGILQPGGASFRLINDSSVTKVYTIPIVNSGIPAGKYNNLVGKTSYLSGTCSGNTFNARNILEDNHFAVDVNNQETLKGNHLYGKVNNYLDTTARLKVRVKGASGDQLLQITHVYDPVAQTATQELHWRIGNIVQTMDMPQNVLDDQGLYRVELENTPQGDRVLLNCMVYDLAFSSGQVSMTPAYNYCALDVPGVVIDENRGVMWARCALGQGNYDPQCQGTPVGFEAPWQAAQACANLQLAGYGDWRLPLLSELQYIANTGQTLWNLRPGGSMNRALFPNGYGAYWGMPWMPRTYCYDEWRTIWVLGIAVGKKKHTVCNNYSQVGVFRYPAYLGWARGAMEWYKKPYGPPNCNTNNTPFTGCVANDYYTSIKTRCIRKIAQ